MTYQTRISALKIGGKTVEQEQDEVDVNNPKADAAIGDLNKDLNETFYKLISSSPKIFSAIHPQDFTENFYITKEELKSYVKGFFRAVSQNVDIAIKENDEDNVNSELFLDTALDDGDVKLSLYRSFKSIYDKWISNSKISKTSNSNGSGYFFNNYGEDGDTRFLYDHFNFVNRANADIGGEAVIDISMLSNLANSKSGGGVTKTLYQTLTDILSKNNFDFFAVPGYISYAESDINSDNLSDMFRAIDEYKPVATKPSFICMYIGGSSRTLDIPRSRCSNDGSKIEFDYADDGFDIFDPTSYPEEFTKNGGGITAFKVRYGQQNQNLFHSLQLDQAEFKETQESLMVIEALTNPRDGLSPGKSGKGNNLYDTYLTRSYSCTVDTLGNLMLQPLMYFKLENVPMFHGTYLIIDVKHDIKPHHAKTTFKGVRQPIVTAPLVTDALSLLDLSLIGQVEDEVGQSLSEVGVGGTGGYTALPADATILPPETISGITVSPVQKFWNSGLSKFKPEKVTGVCLHWTAGYSYKSAAATLQKKGLGYHFIVHEDGTLVQYSDTDRKAWHGGCAGQTGYNKSTGNAVGCHSLNSTAIGISYVGGVKFHSTVTNDEIHNFKGNRQDNESHAYVRTKEEWGMENLSIPNEKTTVQVYNARKQFESIVNAIILAKQKYPNISYITSHHWSKSSKPDVGDDFPWTELQNVIEELTGWKPLIVTDWKDSNDNLIKDAEIPESVYTPEDVEMDETDKGD